MTTFQGATLENGINLGIENIKICSNVKTIGTYAISHTELEEIYIPSTVESVDELGIVENDKLKKVTVDAETIGVQTFISNPELKEVVILDNVKTIGDGAFFMTKKMKNSLETVTFGPNTKIQSVAENAFAKNILNEETGETHSTGEIIGPASKKELIFGGGNKKTWFGKICNKNNEKHSHFMP